MISLLARLFIKPDLDQTAARKAYGILCGAVGIGLNLLLFAGKFLAGLISGSIAVTARYANTTVRMTVTRLLTANRLASRRLMSSILRLLAVSRQYMRRDA